MPSRGKRQQSPAQKAKLQQTRRDLAKLKKAGLFLGDVRNAKGGWRQRKLINANQDVLNGTAQVIKVPKGVHFPEEFRAKNGHIVIPNVRPGEKFRYDKKSGQIIGTHIHQYGRRVRRIIVLHPADSLEQLPLPPKGVTWRYRVMFAQDVTSPGFADPVGLAEFMAPYEVRRPRIRNGKKHGYSQFKRADWLHAVQIDQVASRKVIERENEEGDGE